jgi:hypothetical protein
VDATGARHKATERLLYPDRQQSFHLVRHPARLTISVLLDRATVGRHRSRRGETSGPRARCQTSFPRAPRRSGDHDLEPDNEPGEGLFPTFPCLRPPGMSDQRACGRQERCDHVVYWSGSSTSSVLHPLCPVVAKDIERQFRRRPAVQPKNAEVGLWPVGCRTALSDGRVRQWRRLRRELFETHAGVSNRNDFCCPSALLTRRLRLVTWSSRPAIRFRRSCRLRTSFSDVA